MKTTYRAFRLGNHTVDIVVYTCTATKAAAFRSSSQQQQKEDFRNTKAKIKITKQQKVNGETK